MPCSYELSVGMKGKTSLKLLFLNYPLQETKKII